MIDKETTAIARPTHPCRDYYMKGQQGQAPMAKLKAYFIKKVTTNLTAILKTELATSGTTSLDPPTHNAFLACGSPFFDLGSRLLGLMEKGKVIISVKDRAGIKQFPKVSRMVITMPLNIVTLFVTCYHFLYNYESNLSYLLSYYNIVLFNLGERGIAKGERE